MICRYFNHLFVVSYVRPHANMETYRMPQLVCVNVASKKSNCICIANINLNFFKRKEN